MKIPKLQNETVIWKTLIGRILRDVHHKRFPFGICHIPCIQSNFEANYNAQGIIIDVIVRYEAFWQGPFPALLVNCGEAACDVRGDTGDESTVLHHTGR